MVCDLFHYPLHRKYRHNENMEQHKLKVKKSKSKICLLYFKTLVPGRVRKVKRIKERKKNKMKWCNPFTTEEERCFAWEEHRCRILKNVQCNGKYCSSYKTKKQAEEQNKKCWKRVLSLPEDRRNYILNKYYPTTPEKEKEIEQ